MQDGVLLSFFPGFSARGSWLAGMSLSSFYLGVFRSLTVGIETTQNAKEDPNADRCTITVDNLLDFACVCCMNL